MPRICSVCNSPKRKQIDTAIVEAKEPKRGIARRYGMSPSSLMRHANDCIPAKVAIAAQEEGRSLASELTEARRRVVQVLEHLDTAREGLTVGVALTSGYHDTALKAVAQLAKLAELEFGTKAKLTVSPDPIREWASLPPPEKRIRIAEMKHRILELEAETGGEHEEH